MPAASPIVLPVAQYAPDMPATDPASSANIRNVVPRTPASYGPLAAPAPFSSALAQRCQGAAAYLDAAGNVDLFAGDAQDLYLLTAGNAPSWSPVSKASQAYTIGADQRWSFAQFGGRVLATDFADPIQSFTLGLAGPFADLAAAAPKARYIATVKGFLAAANTSDPAMGAQPQRVWWSALNDPTNWPAPGTAAAAQYQSDYNDLYGEGGWIQGIVGNLGTADGAVFMEHAVWRMVYVGPPAIFDFFPAQGVKGCPAPGSIVQLGNLVYFLGEDGFYVFDGTMSRPIGANRVDKTVFADLDQANLARIVGTVDPINKLILWAYPGSGNSGGNPNHLVIYNWQIDRWSVADVTLETLLRVLSFGYTLDELGTQLGYAIDTLPFPLDSRAWTGGTVLLAGFDASHRLNYFNGGALAATVDSAEIQPFPGRRALVKNARPLVDGGTPAIAIGTRQRLQDAASFGSAVPANALGTCPQRASGRYVRAEVTLPAGASFSHIAGIEIEATPAGIR